MGVTVAELIAELQKLPLDATVYYSDGPHEGQNFAFEQDPAPTLEADGRVCL